MWGELFGASWHQYGASWLGRVGFGANRLAPDKTEDAGRERGMRGGKGAGAIAHGFVLQITTIRHTPTRC